jgi:hypothetical protein
MKDTLTPYYPCEMATLGMLLRRVAIDFVRYQHYYYVSGTIPAQKDPRKTDRKLVATYGITHCRVTRLRERRRGRASIAYARLEHDFILMATAGTHVFFEEESPRDIRQNPYEIRGYSIGVKGGKPCVMIAPKRWKAIAKQAHALALHNEAKVTDYMGRISPFHFPGIVRQQQKLLRQINRRRKRASLSLIQMPAHERYWGHGSEENDKD